MTGRVRAGDEGRWAEAEQLLDDVYRTGPHPEPGRRWPTAWSIGVSVVVVALAVGIGAVVLAGDGSTGREAIGVGLSVLGFVVAAVGGVWMWRSGQRGGRPPLSVLTREDRRLLQDQIRGRRPVDPAHSRLARYRAVQLSQQAPLLLLFAGLCVLVDGQSLEAAEGLLVVLSVALAVAFVAGAVVVPRQIDQGRAFLRQHPEPLTPDSDSPDSGSFVPPDWSAAVVDGLDGPPVV
jgi:hypothetical protein